MAGEPDDAPAREVDPPQLRRVEAVGRAHHGQQRVDDRVPRDPYVARLGALGDEVGAVALGGGVVPGGDRRDEAPVHLLGEGLPAAVRAQPCLHVADGNLGVEGGQRHGERRGGVAVHEHDVGRRAAQHVRGALQYAGREPRQRLALAHGVQVVVHAQAEQARHLVEHLAVLRGRQHADVERGVGAEGAHDRRHLHGLGPRAERDQGPNGLLHACRPSVPGDRPSSPRRPEAVGKKKGPALADRPRSCAVRYARRRMNEMQNAAPAKHSKEIEYPIGSSLHPEPSLSGSASRTIARTRESR